MLDRHEMIDSGIEWIGDIPQNWSVFPAGGVFFEVKEKNTNNEYSNAFSFRYGEIVDKKTNGVEDESVEETLSAYRVVSPDTIMINGLNLNYDFITQRVAIVKEKGIITSAYLAVQPDKDRIVPKFALYLFKAYDAKQVFHGMGSGVRKTLKYSDFKNIKIVAPSMDMQRHIVAYLDCKTQEIDQLIAEAKASIEEYKAWKASIIYEAVTKGLDSDVEMKDSGAEWIGMMPTNWQCLRFKFAANIKANLVDPQDYPDSPQVAPDNIVKDAGILLPCNSVSESGVISWNHLFYKGQILYSKIRPTLNKAVIAPFDGLCSADMYPIETTQNTMFMLYVILSKYFVQQVALCTADRVKMPKINQEELANIQIALPPIVEQEVIANHLNVQCARFDSLISEKESLISDLEAYKKSLIFEVVTGKRRVY